MRKPTKKELQKAREQVESLFLDRDWFEVMKHWQGDGWRRDDIMCGLLVGMKIAENRQKQQARTPTTPADSRRGEEGYERKRQVRSGARTRRH